MQLKSKTGKPLINKSTKLPIYSNTIEARLNKAYKKLTGLTKKQVNNINSLKDFDELKKNEVKSVLFAVKMAGIQSSLSSLSF